MSLTTELWVACVLSVFGGIGNGIQWVSVMTLIQEETPSDLQARVVGLLESIGAAMPGVGFLLGGTLTAVWSAPTAYATAGIGVLVISAAGLATLPRRIGSRSARTTLPDPGVS
jgi:MFS family permease